MIIEKKIFFEKQDEEMLRAVFKFLGKTSPNYREKVGLNENEANLCSKFYNELSVYWGEK